MAVASADDQLSLFDAPLAELAPLPPAPPGKTRGQIRIARQAEALRHGYHPLHLTTAHGLRLHPGAAPADDKAAAGHRCGTCWFRRPLSGHARSYPKCLFPSVAWAPGGWPRQSDGDGTDVRRWWPACTDYRAEPAGDPAGGEANTTPSS